MSQDSDPQEQWETASTQSDSAVVAQQELIVDENAVYSEEEVLKAEEFKDKGNEYFKGKFLSLCSKSIREIFGHVHGSNFV